MLPEGERAERSLVVSFFLKTPPFSSWHLIQLSQSPELPESFLLIPTDRRGKPGSILAFSLPQSKAMERGSEESYKG